MNENQIMQQAIKTNRGSARSAEQEKRKGKLQVELSLKAFCFFQLIFFSSLALAIARKEARDGLVAIPMSSKKEKVKRKRGEKRRLPGFIYSGGDKLENADEEEEEILAALNDREDYEEVAQFGKNEFSHEITHMSTSSLLKVSRYSCLFFVEIVLSEYPQGEPSARTWVFKKSFILLCHLMSFFRKCHLLCSISTPSVTLPS